MPFQILPAETRFFDWFEKGASNLLAAARALHGLATDYQHVEAKVAAITELEHNGDCIVHEIVDLLNRTFLTPLDAGDTHRLTSAIDDVVDRIEAAADTMLLYHIERPTPEAVRLTELILGSAEAINQAVPMLRDKKRAAEMRERTIEVNRLENEADRVLRDGMAALLARPDELRRDPERLFELVRWKEIYHQLEEATDGCEDVADVLLEVAMKQA